ncbi:hypothetical protein Bbelb_262120 [Branchiostoma belcheri]|nr:hypothetical protein Bbelb_262120 [Branchiostoma belcheri]
MGLLVDDLGTAAELPSLPRTPADQGWLKPLSHIQNLPPNTSRPRLAEAPVTHSEPSPEHQPTKNLPPNTSRPRLAEAPVTHSEPSPEHQPTKNLPPNTSRPRLAEAPATHSEPSPEHQPTKSHGLYPFRPEDRRGETLSEYPEYDDGLSDSDWAAMLLEKERPERRGSIDLDWFPRVSDSSPPPLNLKDLVLGKPNMASQKLAELPPTMVRNRSGARSAGVRPGRLLFSCASRMLSKYFEWIVDGKFGHGWQVVGWCSESRRFWNTPMGSGNKAGQPMALNLQTNAGRLPLGDLMKVRIKRTHGPADVADRWQFQADARGKAIKGGA